ncbi:TPA: hypothetical protein VIQ72_001759 [Streptococcus pyogenes]|nr:hypothetical protein [Streptococcus pyogenes]
MKTLTLSGKPYPIHEGGKVVKTEVRLIGDNGLFIPIELIGDQTAKGADDLIKEELESEDKVTVIKYADLVKQD